MKISKFTKPDLDYFREQCNFVGFEKDLFEMRSEGIPLQIIAENYGYTRRGLDNVSKEVNNKIKRVLELRKI